MRSSYRGRVTAAVTSFAESGFYTRLPQDDCPEAYLQALCPEYACSSSPQTLTTPDLIISIELE